LEPKRKTRVLLVDDHAVLRAGLRALINAEPDMEVVGEAGNGEDAVTRTRELRPDVVVMDISMPRLNGLEATKRIVELGLQTKVLVLTMHSEEQYLTQVLQSGGMGYVLKRSADTELMEAIRTVNRGEAFLYPSATRLLVEDYLVKIRGSQERDSFAELTEREREVLKLTVEGFSNQEIADKLIISPKTVDTYRARIMEKLNLHHRSELIRYALKKGLLRAQE
jgi:two-component system, NarL family, response regulator NreC